MISAEPNHVKLEFTVTNDVLNTVGTLHGGCTATILDVCMSLSHFASNEITGKNFGGTIDMTIQLVLICFIPNLLNCVL